MKIRITLIIGLLLIGLAALIAYGSSNSSNREVGNLPWKIETNNNGNPTVLGLTIGETTLDEANQLLHRAPDISVFLEPSGEYRLEAYYGKIYVGVFEARIIATLQATRTELEAIVEASRKRKPMPSGSYEVSLNETQMFASGTRVITQLSYSPVADLSAEQIRGFFGEPSNRLKVGLSGEYWFYPEKSAVVLLEEEDKELFYYVQATDYPQLQETLKQFIEAETARLNPENR